MPSTAVFCSANLVAIDPFWGWYPSTYAQDLSHLPDRVDLPTKYD